MKLFKTLLNFVLFIAFAIFLLFPSFNEETIIMFFLIILYVLVYINLKKTLHFYFLFSVESIYFIFLFAILANKNIASLGKDLASADILKEKTFMPLDASFTYVQGNSLASILRLTSLNLVNFKFVSSHLNF
tara:strand:- start:879 stop:1274 length:396 start_codon:yes stop_codon:yes gene_type:complete